jgi:hypothetical protein
MQYAAARSTTPFIACIVNTILPHRDPLEKLKCSVLEKLLAMAFFPVELTEAEMVYIDEIVDDILQDSRVRCPSDTVISFLRRRVHYPVQKYELLSVPSLLHDFMLK